MALTDDDYEDGIIELSELGSDAMAAVVAAVESMSEATHELTAKFEQRIKEAEQLATGGSFSDTKSAKRVANNLANDLEIYVRRLAVETTEFHTQHTLATDIFGKIAVISGTDFREDPEDVKTALAAIQEYRVTISASSDSLSELRQKIAALPRMSTAFNRARRRTTAVMDDLLVQLRTGGTQIQDVEQLLIQMIKSAEESS